MWALPRSLLALLLALAAVLLAACGGGESSSSDVTGPAAFGPAEAPIYLEATLKPQGDQKDNAEALLSKLGDVPLLGSQIDPADLADQAVQQFNAAVGADVDYATDVQPWLGDKAGFALLPDGATGVTSYVLAVETSDDDVARDSLAKILENQDNTQHNYDGVDYSTSANGIYSYGVFDGALVFSTTNEFEAAVDAEHNGSSLGAGEDFQSAFGPLGDDSLASFYVDFNKAAELDIAQNGGDSSDIDKARGLFPELFNAPLAASLVAGPDSLALDTSLSKVDDEPAFEQSDQLEAAPADAFAALGIDDAGGLFDVLVKRLGQTGEAIGDPDLSNETIAQAFDQLGVSQDEVASAFGDGVAYATGDPAALSATLKLAVDDDSSTGAAAKLIALLKQVYLAQPDVKLGPAPNGSETGFTADARSAPEASGLLPYVAASLGSGFATLEAVSDADQLGAESSISTLGDEPKFTAAVDALGSDYAPLAFADLGPILESVFGSFSLASAALGSTPPEQAIPQFISSKLEAAAAGTRIDGNRLVVRTVVTLGD